MNAKFKIWLIVLLTGLYTLNSCKQYYDPPLVFEPDPGQNLTKDRKVLLISIDGLAGLELKKYTPANITKMLANAKYTYEGIADANTHDAASWTTLLSGKGSSKHGVTGNSFIAGEDGEDDDIHDHEGNGTSTGYISVYQRLLETGRSLKTLSVSSWNELDQYLFNLSDENGVVASDEAVKNKAVDRIKNGEDNLSFSTINFRGVNDAGKSGGFSVENVRYKVALDQIDGYIGEILKAVSERKRIEMEDWLVILTSNHGGKDNSYGGATLEERKVPIIFYNSNFSKLEFKIPAFTNGFRARNGINASIVATEAGRYNIGTSGDYTIQLKLMVHQFGTLNPAIISKQNNTGNSDDGWSFIHNGGIGWRFKIKGTQVTSGQKFDVGKWYTLTARIYMDGATRKAQVFTDGEMAAEGNLGTAQGNSTVPLNVGYSASYVGGALIQSVKDVKIYDTALPVDHIKQTYCRSENGNSDIYKSNLIGAWSVGDGIGNKLANDVLGAPDFAINGAYSWEFMQNDFCKLLTGEEDTKDEKLLYSVDILPQIFYWLHVTTADSWGLEGKVFLDAYEKEFIGK